MDAQVILRLLVNQDSLTTRKDTIMIIGTTTKLKTTMILRTKTKL